MDQYVLGLSLVNQNFTTKHTLENVENILQENNDICHIIKRV